MTLTVKLAEQEQRRLEVIIAALHSGVGVSVRFIVLRIPTPGGPALRIGIATVDTD